MCWGQYKTYALGVSLILCVSFFDWGSGHGSAHPTHKNMDQGERPRSMHDPKVSQDAEHIKEHYKGEAEFNESAMSPEELEFHYFKLHDFDNNTKLDGLEILKALTELLPYEDVKERERRKKSGEQQKQDELKYYTDIIDEVLENDDLDGDGYLTYLEYVLARKREEHYEKMEMKKKEKGEQTGHHNKKDKTQL